MASSIAAKMRQALSDNKLVPPEIISDRYVFYRVPEFLLAYLDCDDTLKATEPLPYEKQQLNLHHEQSGIYVFSDQRKHIVANLAKGGVVKVFEKGTNRLLLNDCGIIGKLTNGRVVTSQWIDSTYRIERFEKGWQVKGHLNIVPSNKLFTPFKNIIFRSLLICTGWHSGLAHFIKGSIRKSLILGLRHIPISFIRRVEIGDTIKIYNRVKVYEKKYAFESLSIGDEFFVRYVPQSRYFQSQELTIEGWTASSEDIRELNAQGVLEKTVEIG